MYLSIMCKCLNLHVPNKILIQAQFSCNLLFTHFRLQTFFSQRLNCQRIQQRSYWLVTHISWKFIYTCNYVLFSLAFKNVLNSFQNWHIGVSSFNRQLLSFIDTATQCQDFCALYWFMFGALCGSPVWLYVVVGCILLMSHCWSLFL
jgi:hypothetical protein